MKNQDNIKMNVSYMQYPKGGIFPVFKNKSGNKKFCHIKKVSIFARQNKKMNSNLHIHHHHFTKGVSYDVFM